ncbi:MAG TPA: hypothetical protein VH164_03405 [Ktedonobacteraceae bacterium]|nr:hypothetical protein [Ktedonobacteraceae bacterium]
MTHQSSSRREEAATQKDLKKLQQREQRMLHKLAEAREVQTRAMKRFAQAQARVLLVERRLQAVRERLQAPQMPDKAAREDSSQPTIISGKQNTTGQTATPTPIDVAPDAEDRQTAQAIPCEMKHVQAEPTATMSPHKDECAPEAPAHADMPGTPGEVADQPTDEIELLSLVAEISASANPQTLPQTSELQSLAAHTEEEDLEEPLI